nr:Blue copper protein [Ipomoea batatas]
MATQVIKLLNSFIPLSWSSRIFLICLALLDAAKSETYTVGDGDEWSSGTNYVAWSEKHKFMTTFLVRPLFKYVKGQHNVYEVAESTYESCDTSSGILGKYESGNDQVKLKEARKYWFVCDKDGHCLGGMRFGINMDTCREANSSIVGWVAAERSQSLDSRSSQDVLVGGPSSYVVIPHFAIVEDDGGAKAPGRVDARAGDGDVDEDEDHATKGPCYAKKANAAAWAAGVLLFLVADDGGDGDVEEEECSYELGYDGAVE